MNEENTQLTIVLITDDHALRELVSESLKARKGFALIETAGQGRSGLEIIRMKQPDVILVDAVLPDMSGFDLIRQIPQALQIQVVLLSSDTQDAVRAFEYFASDFLLKPVSRERLQLSWFKLSERMRQQSNSLLQEKLNALFRYIKPGQANSKAQANGHRELLPVKMNGRIYFIQPSDIEYVEAAGYYIEVYASGKKHLIRQSLTQLDGILDSGKFIRIHRSVIINLKYLKEIVRDGANDFSARMTNDALFKISRSYKSEVFERIGL